MITTKTRRNGTVDVYIDGRRWCTLAADLTHLAGPYLTPDQLTQVKEDLAS